MSIPLTYLALSSSLATVSFTQRCVTANSTSGITAGDQHCMQRASARSTNSGASLIYSVSSFPFTGMVHGSPNHTSQLGALRNKKSEETRRKAMDAQKQSIAILFCLPPRCITVCKATRSCKHLQTNRSLSSGLRDLLHYKKSNCQAYVFKQRFKYVKKSFNGGQVFQNASLYHHFWHPIINKRSEE